jgi:hypothetical protein
VRGQSGGGGAEAVVGVREERAPVRGGAVLWLEVEAREVATAWRRSGTKTQCGGEEILAGGGTLLKGAMGTCVEARGRSSYSGTAWRRGERGGVWVRVEHGREVTAAGLIAAGAGGCR